MTTPTSAQPSPVGEGSSGSPTALRRLLYFLIFGLVIVGITGGTVLLLLADITNRLRTPRHEPVTTVESLQISTFARFDEAKVFPVGITALPDGTRLLSLLGNGQIVRLNPDGSSSLWSLLTAPGAIAADADGSVYVVDYSAPDFRALGKLKRITPEGKVTYYGDALNAGGLSLLAQIALDGAGNVYVSDPDRALIWRVLPGGVAAPWWAIPTVGTVKAVPIGLAYRAQHNQLLAADSGTGTIYQIDLNVEQPTGEPLYRKAGIDVRTLTIDAQGQIYVSLWQHENGQVARLEADGTLTVLAEKFRAPLGMVAVEGKVYVVNSDLPGLIAQINAEPPFTVDVLSSK
ncbi:MAG: hypothetical protein IAE83_10230 [Anaerolinea sp.]|nr:hypothetical protein [Anaerolinea sp.]MCC6975710.1 hypothetical protein [Anaerolineae bacterium]